MARLVVFSAPNSIVSVHAPGKWVNRGSTGQDRDRAGHLTIGGEVGWMPFHDNIGRNARIGLRGHRPIGDQRQIDLDPRMRQV